MRAFSLVELSIVLVILGLLTGGILAGQSLIKAAELRKVVTEANRTVTAIYTFRDKYMALPGDMPNAFSFWGAAAGCTNVVNSDVAPQGCNGNGNGRIEDRSASGEDLRAYQFMALAGLIEGNYTGLIAPTGKARQFGHNLPAPIMNNGGWWLNDRSATQWTNTGMNIEFSAENNNYPGVAVLTPEQQWNLDSKLDDGKPTTGKATTITTNTTCYDAVTLDYILTTSSPTCLLLYWLN